MLFVFSIVSRNLTGTCAAVCALCSVLRAQNHYLVVFRLHALHRLRSQLQSAKFIMKSVKINYRYKYISDAPDALPLFADERLRFFVGSQSKSHECFMSPILFAFSFYGKYCFLLFSPCAVNILSHQIKMGKKLTNWHSVQCLDDSTCNLVQGFQETRLQFFKIGF